MTPDTVFTEITDALRADQHRVMEHVSMFCLTSPVREFDMSLFLDSIRDEIMMEMVLLASARVTYPDYLIASVIDCYLSLGEHVNEGLGALYESA